MPNNVPFKYIFSALEMAWKSSAHRHMLLQYWLPLVYLLVATWKTKWQRHTILPNMHNV
jgi:hypothetical protein